MHGVPQKLEISHILVQDVLEHHLLHNEGSEFADQQTPAAARSRSTPTRSSR